MPGGKNPCSHTHLQLLVVVVVVAAAVAAAADAVVGTMRQLTSVVFSASGAVVASARAGGCWRKSARSLWLFRRRSDSTERITAIIGSNNMAPITMSRYAPSCPVPAFGVVVLGCTIAVCRLRVVAASFVNTTPTKTIAFSTSQHDSQYYRIYCTPQVWGTVNPIVKESCWEVETAFVVVGVVCTSTSCCFSRGKR
jgi:hypothetical protein